MVRSVSFRGLARALALFALMVLLAAVGDASSMYGQEKKLDPEKGFQFADTDKDGKITREEFKALLMRGGKLKEDGKLPDLLFDRLDADKDGKLTLDEFKKLGEAGAALKGKKDGKFFPKMKKDDPEKGQKSTSGNPAFNDKPTGEQIAFFEKKIRPVMVEQCFSCHSTAKGKAKGGLALDTKAGTRKGGDTGPSIVPNEPAKSLLIKVMKHVDDSPKMPPKQKLSDDIVADFSKWISMGAPDPREGGAESGVAAAPAHTEIDIAKGKQFWAFQKPKKEPAPNVADANWAKTEVDRFLFAELQKANLKPVGEADKRTLIRRIAFDLTGLPPTPEAVDAFVRDNSPDATAKLIDTLLASPRFGERWGRHWLDVARFAESSGKAANISYPHSWRYRDYVVKSFNDDKPYDRFVKEQIAGDLLPAANDSQKAEQLIATGFLAIGPKAHNERNPNQFMMDLIDEQIDTTFQAFLGLTVACARCHDHKFDPIPQKDYYALAGIFRSTEPCYGTVRSIQSAHPSPLLPLPAASQLPPGVEPMTAAKRDELTKRIEELRKSLGNGTFGTPTDIRTRQQISIIEGQLTMFDKEGNPKLQAMGVRERPSGRDIPMLARGEIDKPGEIVPRGMPQVLTNRPLTIRSGSGRKELAEWMTGTENPLTARVMVNRVYSHLFGAGLVASMDNFGASGSLPSNPKLLDSLAVSFMENGWSVKKLIRSLMLTHAYQLASTNDPKNFDSDPENIRQWRMSPRRLEAESIRDSMLVLSGQLDLQQPNGSEVMKGGEAPAQALFRLKSPFAPEDKHRSLYLPIIREQLPESLSLFDFPDPSAVAGERATTSVPAQSLYLMNNPFVVKQAEAFADRLLASTGNDSDHITRAYQMAFSREPSARELAAAKTFLSSYSQQAGFSRKTKHANWTAFCQALMASAEFMIIR